MSLKVGDRVDVRGYRGFVRYLGQVDGYGETEWVGIEWDDPTRGKHNGTIKGYSYFKCSSERGASFIKRRKVHNGGRRSFLKAVQLRYHVDDHVQSGIVEHVGNAQVELIGMEKEGQRQGNWKELRHVSLRGLGVCSIEKDVSLELVLPKVQHLDLGECLISSFEMLYDIIKGLPNLTLLDVSRNRFPRSSKHNVGSNSDLQHMTLKTLIFNETNVSWENCVMFGAKLPNLEKLCLHRVGICTLEEEANTSPSEVFKNLKTLDLDGNLLSWEAIMNLRHLPSLTHLLLSNNRIRRIRIEDGAQIPLFRMLQHLNLDQNSIDEWTSIVHVQRIEALRSLRMRDNPLTADVRNNWNSRGVNVGMPQSRSGVIARIPQLKILDGANVTTDERCYAEKEYIKEILNSTRDEVSKIVKDHPQLLKLCKQYDVDVDSSLEGRSKQDASVVQAGTIAADVVKVKLVNADAGRKTKSSEVKLLPMTTAVYKVKGLFPRVFKFPQSTHIRLDLIRKVEGCSGDETDKVPVVMDDDYRCLKDYRVSNGCEIIGTRIKQ